MQIIGLIVKGNEQEATHAAESRGFKIEKVSSASADHTCLRAEGSIDVAATWFLEQAACVKGYGYPAGTLLFYR